MHFLDCLVFWFLLCENKVCTITFIFSIWPWLISLLNSFHPHEEDLSSTNGKNNLNLVLLTLFSITNGRLRPQKSRFVFLCV